MSYLTLDADRLVRDAVDAFLEGRLRPDSGGDCVYASRNSQYRVVEGRVEEATDTSLLGAEIVGWLVEELGRPMIEARWRPYGRAVFVERKTRHVVVTSRTLTRNAIGGNVSPVPESRRRPSVIPAAPPIPVLRSSSIPVPATDGSPTPFRMSEALDAAIRAADSRPPSDRPPRSHELPTSRPPPDEVTVSAARSSLDSLVESTREPVLPTGEAPPFAAPAVDPSGAEPGERSNPSVNASAMEAPSHPVFGAPPAPRVPSIPGSSAEGASPPQGVGTASPPLDAPSTETAADAARGASEGFPPGSAGAASPQPSGAPIVPASPPATDSTETTANRGLAVPEDFDSFSGEDAATQIRSAEAVARAVQIAMEQVVGVGAAPRLVAPRPARASEPPPPPSVNANRSEAHEAAEQAKGASPEAPKAPAPAAFDPDGSDVIDVSEFADSVTGSVSKALPAIAAPAPRPSSTGAPAPRPSSTGASPKAPPAPPSLGRVGPPPRKVSDFIPAPRPTMPFGTPPAARGSSPRGGDLEDGAELADEPTHDAKRR